MITDTQLTGGSVPLYIGDEELQATPFTDVDYAEIDSYVQAKIIQSVKEALRDEDDQQFRQEVVVATIKTAVTIRWFSPEGQSVLSTVEGNLRIGWQLIKAKHKDITFKQFVAFCKQKGDLKKIFEEIDRVYALVNITEEDDDTDKSNDKEDNSQGKKHRRKKKSIKS